MNPWEHMQISSVTMFSCEFNNHTIVSISAFLLMRFGIFWVTCISQVSHDANGTDVTQGFGLKRFEQAEGIVVN